MKKTSLLFKINAIGLSIGLIFILMCSFILYLMGKQHLNYEYKQVNTFLSVLFEQKREEIANEIFADQDLALSSSLNDIIKINGILKVDVYDKKGRLLLSAEKRANTENSLSHYHQSNINPSKKKKTGCLRHLDLPEKFTRILDRHALFITEVPWKEDTACYSSAIKVIGEQVGYLRIYYDLYPIKHHITEIITIFAICLVVLAIFMSWISHILFSRFIIKPVLKLKKAMGEVENGILGVTIDLDSKDEIGEMGRAFNEMSKKLLQNNNALKNAVKIEGRYALKLAKVNAELKNLNTRLENIVQERTADLLKANQSLKKEMKEKEKMEKELLKVQKLESIGLLAGGIAHDFNNILSAIIGNLSLAQTYAGKNDKIKKYLTDTEKSCLRAKDLTNQLLTFSKGGAPVKKLISMPDFIKESVVFVLRGSNVGYELKIDPDLAHAEIDKGQINQVMNNIIINAIQAMPDGGKITVQAENCVMKKNSASLPVTPGNYIKISIKDQGHGISKNNINNIFDPYFTTKQDGNGLGLTSVYSIVKRHSGYIYVQSVETKGTIFEIYLPASKKKIQSNTSECVRSGKTTAFNGHGNILIMDDDEMIREIVGDMLIHMGYEVDFANDGEEACRKYIKAMEKKEKFDAVIMDLTIPGGMGGQEAVKKILKTDPKAKVVVSSGYSNDPVMADYKLYGFSGVIVKPFQMNELKSLMQELMSKRHTL